MRFGDQVGEARLRCLDMCGAGMVDIQTKDVEDVRQEEEKRKTSEKFHGCSKGKHTVDDCKFGQFNTEISGDRASQWPFEELHFHAWFLFHMSPLRYCLSLVFLIAVILSCAACKTHFCTFACVSQTAR